MNHLVRVAVLVTIFAVGASFTPAATDLRDTLRSENIASMRVSLNPWGGQIGFEIEFAADGTPPESHPRALRVPFVRRGSLRCRLPCRSGCPARGAPGPRGPNRRPRVQGVMQRLSSNMH